MLCSLILSLQAAEDLDASNSKWQHQLRVLQQKHAAAEAEMVTSHRQQLEAQQQALRTEAVTRLAAAESLHAQQLQQLQQQLAAARALASTIEDGAGQQAARLQEQLHLEQQAVADLQQQVSQLQEQLQEAASKLQESDGAQVCTAG
jgi:chromosome segregation ATPase